MLYRAASLGVSWDSVTHIALTHFHQDHWGELPAYLFALRWGTEPRRRDPVTLIGPAGLGQRLEALARAYGEWVVAPEYPLRVREIGAAETMALGTDVLLETCKTPHTDESLAYGVRHGGLRLVYTGDTGESDALADWAADCDLLLAECSLPDERAMDIHLTPTRAGALARRARARRLVLTHLYPVYGASNPASAAAAAFGGDVRVARDGDRFVIEER